MEEVLNNLQKIKDFRVLSRTSTDQYKDKDRSTVPEIAKKLNVNYIVEGSGQKYGNKFVLRVQLLVAKNERHIWGKSYDREILQTSDIINIQSEIAQAIAAELNAVITPEEKQLIEKKTTTNLTAYDFYQQGEEERNKYNDNTNKQDLIRAAELYRESLKYDSTFAKAYVGLAWVYQIKHYL
jgi:TolB-like protein